MLHMTTTAYTSNAPIIRPRAASQLPAKCALPLNLKELPVLDIPRLQQLVLGNPDILQALKTAFSEDTQKRLQALKALSQESNPTHNQLKQLLHALKGEARSIAATRLGELAYYLEQQAEENNYTALFTHLPLLEEEFFNWQFLMNSTDWQIVLQNIS